MSVEGRSQDQQDAVEDKEGGAETNSILDSNMSTTGVVVPSIGQETGCETVSICPNTSDFRVHRFIDKWLSSYYTIK